MTKSCSYWSCIALWCMIMLKLNKRILLIARPHSIVKAEGQKLSPYKKKQDFFKCDIHSSHLDNCIQHTEYIIYVTVPEKKVLVAQKMFLSYSPIKSADS